MTTMTRRPARSISRLDNGRVRITCGRLTTDYTVVELPCEIGGRGFEVSNMSSMEIYHTRIHGRDRSCDCLGHYRHGHCKHADGLARLITLGKL
jgi:hypothetical protein